MNPSLGRATGISLLLLLSFPAFAGAQDLEPRRWTHLPVGTNIFGAGYVFTTGQIKLDPALRIDDVSVEMHTLALSYSRYFALFDRTSRVDVRLPFQSGSWEGLVNGVPDSVSRDGLADPSVRLSVNLAGAPALSRDGFMDYRKKHSVNTSVGVALDVRLPLGEHMDDKLINLGQNRFVINGQLGVLHTRRDWSFELTGSTYLYTDNEDFFSGNELEQDPLFAAQAHAVKTFDQGEWLSAGIAYGWAGSTTVNGQSNDDDRGNLLLGFSFGFPIGESQGIKLGYWRGDTLTRVDADTHNLLLAWSIRF